MSRASVAFARLRGLFARRRLERELDDEIRFHLEMQIEENARAGMNWTDARNAALRSFGGIEPVKERYRERRTYALVESMAQDARYAARVLGKSPGFTIPCIAVLALAIGANTAMFSVLNAVLIRPLPYRSPEQLAMLWTGMPGRNIIQSRSGYGSAEAWRRQNRSFADLAVFDPVSVTLRGAEKAERIGDARISANFFELLGIRPYEGRFFSAEEAEQRQRVVVISHRFWQSHLGGSPDTIGRSIEIDGAPSRITGILPPDFRFAPLDADVWEPQTIFSDWEARRVARGPGPWFVVGRLRAGVSLEQAQAEMSALARRLDEQLPAGERDRGISVVPLSLHVTGPKARLALWMLTGVVFCVLLIAASNVAGVLLARGAARAREIAVRAALGASRARIVRQLLAESLILSGVSGLIGLFLAWAGIRLIRYVSPGDLSRLNEARLDPRAMGCALALCLLTGILAGLAPAATLGRCDAGPPGHEAKGIAGGALTHRMRRVLVVTEFALAIILLTGAGLLIRSLRSIENVDPGFRAERVLSAQLSTPEFSGKGLRAEFYSRVLAEVQSLPGVERAGVIENFFTSGSPEQTVTIEGDGRTISERLRLRQDAVSENFFATLGTPLLRGRFFSAEDGPDSPRVAIVNRAMARRLWPGREAAGNRFRLGAGNSDDVWFTVVGVAGDMRRQGLENEAVPQMFEPFAQNPSRLATLLVRTSTDDPLRLAGAVEAAVHRVEKYAPVYGVTTLERQLGGYLAERRFQTWLLTCFSAMAVLIAAIGIYGLIQYSVAMRTHEIGIRMAVGAQSGDVFRMMIREGLRLSLTGLSVGLLGAVWVSRAGSSFLFGVTGTDPLTFLAVSAILTGAAAAACYLPARRAMKIDPIAALRHL